MASLVTEQIAVLKDREKSLNIAQQDNSSSKSEETENGPLEIESPYNYKTPH